MPFGPIASQASTGQGGLRFPFAFYPESLMQIIQQKSPPAITPPLVPPGAIPEPAPAPVPAPAPAEPQPLQGSMMPGAPIQAPIPASTGNIVTSTENLDPEKTGQIRTSESMLTSLNPVQMGAGIIGGIAGVLQQNAAMKRMEEAYNRDAYGGLSNVREQMQNVSPEATRRATQAQLSTAQGAAVSNAMNMAAGKVAQQGGVAIGGQAQRVQDVAAMAAAAPFAQQMAQAEQSYLQNQQQKLAQLEGVNNSIANLSNHVSYLQEQRRNPLLGLLEGTLAGATGGSQLKSLIDNSAGLVAGR